jgi:hypothetical protein
MIAPLGEHVKTVLPWVRTATTFADILSVRMVYEPARAVDIWLLCCWFGPFSRTNCQVLQTQFELNARSTPECFTITHRIPLPAGWQLPPYSITTRQANVKDLIVLSTTAKEQESVRTCTCQLLQQQRCRCNSNPDHVIYQCLCIDMLSS